MNSTQQDWLDTLAGRSRADAEAKSTREYFLRRIAEDADANARPDEMRERRMLNYLRAKGAFAEQAVPESQGLLARIRQSLRQLLQSVVRHPAIAAGVAAALLMAPVANRLWLRGTPDMPIESQVEYRGELAVVQLAAAEPEALAKRVASALQQRQIAYRQTVRNAAIVIETRIPPEHRAAMQAAWSEWKVAIPANGIVVIQISSKR